MAVFTDGVFSDQASGGGGGAPSGAAGGGLSGTYPNPDVVLTATHIAFGSGTNTLTSSAELTYVTATGVLDLAKSLSGAFVVNKARNTSNTAGSGAQFLAEVAGTTADDPLMQWSVAGTRQFVLGIDTSSSGRDLVACLGTTLSVVPHFKLSGSGNTQVLIGGVLASSFTASVKLAVRTTSGSDIAQFTENQNVMIGQGATEVTSTTLRMICAKTIASATSAVWDAVDVIATSVATLSGSTAITTATGFNLMVLRAPTITAASALTVSFASTLYIGGAPIAAGAGPATITNAYAIWSDSGLNRFDGNGTRVFELPADATGNVTVATGRVPILVGGVTKFLRYFDD